jgi:hypothetical protein
MEQLGVSIAQDIYFATQIYETHPTVMTNFGTQYVGKQLHVSAYFCKSWYWHLSATFAVTIQLHPATVESIWHVLNLCFFNIILSVSHVFQDLALISLTTFT